VIPDRYLCFRMKAIALSITGAMLMIMPGCNGLVNSLSFFPDRNYLLNSDSLPPQVEEKIIATPDGVNLQILYFRHNKGSGKVVVYFHGNAGNLYGRIDEGERIFSMGHDVVISGYRGYGRSSGEPTEGGVYIDGRTVCGYVRDTLGYPVNKIFIYGRSIGTTVAVDAAMGRECGGVILVTPFSSAVDFIKEKYPDLFSGIGYGHFESEKKINRLKAPLLVIHGTSDEIVPYKLGVKLYNAYNGEKELVTIENGMHNDLELTDPVIFWGAFEKFIRLK